MQVNSVSRLIRDADADDPDITRRAVQPNSDLRVMQIQVVKGGIAELPTNCCEWQPVGSFPDIALNRKLRQMHVAASSTSCIEAHMVAFEQGIPRARAND
jgi:hypothetical protein